MTRYCVVLSLSGATYEVRPISSAAAVAYCPNEKSAVLVCDALNASEKPTLDRVAGSADSVAALASAVCALGSLGRVADAEDLAVALVREAKALAEAGSTK